MPKVNQQTIAEFADICRATVFRSASKLGCRHLEPRSEGRSRIFIIRFPARWAAIPLLVGFMSSSLFADAPSRVEIRKSSAGGFELLRNGEPFFINGAGGIGYLENLVQAGGNSIRTWGIEQLEEINDGKNLLDRAYDLGLAVSVGLWVQHERHGFSYNDPVAVQKQRDDIRDAVRKYKNHPAVLVWSLGNEMEGPTSDGSDPRIWKELEQLARIIKEEDPNHPVMTVIASAAPTKVQGIQQHYPSIDILGVNSYGGAMGVASALSSLGWDKPFAVTEFGPFGHWEVGKTSWGAPIEPSCRDKAETYYATKTKVVEDGRGKCIGTYVFFWGQKQEVTSTWYGMFLKSGEKLPTVDAMTMAWTGKWPANRSPIILKIDSPLTNATVPRGNEFSVEATVEDREGDFLNFEWEVRAESTERSVGGDAESEPPAINGCLVSHQGGKALIRTPSKAGAYRLFLIVRDGKGGASADNLPFLVQ